jgi:hypothetical protein
MDKEVLPPITAIIMPGKNQEDTINSLLSSNDTQAINADGNVEHTITPLMAY